jgi:hypothetical protein
MREHLPSHLSKWDCTSTFIPTTNFPIKFKTYLTSFKKNLLSSIIPLKKIPYNRFPLLLIIVPRVHVIGVSLLIELEWYTHSLMWVDMASKTPFNFDSC